MPIDPVISDDPLGALLYPLYVHNLQVQVYSSTTNHVIKTISRFNEAAYSGCLRADGKLLVAGSQEGVVKVFEMNSRAILRQFKGHTK